MKRWMIVALGLVGIGLALAAPAAPEDGPGVLPGLRLPDLIRLQRHALTGASPETWLTPPQLALMQRYGHVPDGAEQYGHDLLLAVPDLTADQRAALTVLVANDTVTTHKRFWRLAYLLLTPQQAQALTPRLPLALQHKPNPNNWFSLPGLTAAQEHRIKARFTEVEATTEPIEGRIKALEASIKSAPEADRPHLQDEMLSLQEDAVTRVIAAEDDVSSTITPEQRAALLELPPFTEGEEQHHALGDVIDGVTLTPDQAHQMQPIIQALQTLQADAAEKAKRLKTEAPAEDGDDPMTMMLTMRGLQDPVGEAQLKAAHQLVAWLSDEQRIAWLRK